MKQTTFNTGWTCTAYGQTFDVTLPHDYMIGSVRKADNKTGPDIGFFTPDKATYKKTFTVEKPAKTTLLRFDGVMGLCEVSLNGQKIGFHPYGYTAFVCDMTPYLRAGENTLTVTSDTTAQQASRWYTGGGIYRDVDVLSAEGAYIAPWGVYVCTRSLRGDRAELGVKVTARADKATPAVINVLIGGEKHTHRVCLPQGESEFEFRCAVKDITPWTVETPALYDCQVELATDGYTDTACVRYGVRTVETDPARGLLLNGEVIKLYGGCVHHDNGVVGAAAYAAAEERRVRILKSQGFNAIRCAHNPPSTAMLDACDRLGMLVIDEIFDCWRVQKKDYDYHLWFDAYWEADTTSMVVRDRNHPSVIIWSTGNEILERDGQSGGYLTHKKIADTIRRLDYTRPLTNAVCGLWSESKITPEDKVYLDHSPTEMDDWAVRTAPLIDTLEIAGYNYLHERLDADEARFPDRLVIQTESFPLDAGDIKKRLDSDPRFVGDFVWTSWDYFGETCIGHVKFDEEKAEGLLQHPNHIANCGDMDVCGFRKPQSYYREAMWREDAVTILTGAPDIYGQAHTISRWGFHPAERTWTYPGAEGKKCDIYVFSLCDEVELLLNDRSMGRKAPDATGTARFECSYEPGVLSARAYKNGACVGEDAIETAREWTDIAIRRAPTDANDLCYYEISLTDEQGRVDPTAADEIDVSVEGGLVVGTGSGRIDDEHIYTQPACRAYMGRILCAVRPTGGAVKVTATCGGKTATA